MCTRWENFIRIWITVQYLKSWRCQLWIWRSQISVLLAPLCTQVKLHLRPSNPQLTLPILQIQYCYSLICKCLLVKYSWTTYMTLKIINISIDSAHKRSSTAALNKQGIWQCSLVVCCKEMLFVRMLTESTMHISVWASK